MKTFGKRIGVLGVVLMMLGSVTGCSFFPLPHEQRYQYINNVLEEVDYETAGTIVEEQIDDGDGVFAPSYKKVYYKEKSAYTTLVERMEKLPNYECRGSVETDRFKCIRGRVTVGVALWGKANKETYFVMTDGSSGRG